MAKSTEIIASDRGGLRDANQEIGMSGDIFYFEVPLVTTLHYGMINIRMDKKEYTGSPLILGNSTFGQLGNNWLGVINNNINTIRELENRLLFDIIDDIDDDSNEDASNTNASWGTVGSFVLGDSNSGRLGSHSLGASDVISFTGGSQAQSINLGSDIKLNTTKLNRARVLVDADNSTNLSGSVSMNAGTDWTGIEFGRERVISPTGSEPVVRFVDKTNSATINEFEAVFRQDDL